jgi:hypothetical protein
MPWYIPPVGAYDSIIALTSVSWSKTIHKVVQPPNSNLGDLPSPQMAWEAFYPKGSINPSADIPGGFTLFQKFADRLQTASEVVMSYRMMLQEGWEWRKGGKLPGVCKYHVQLVNIFSLKSLLDSSWWRRRIIIWV